jgi:hypothetical protein
LPTTAARADEVKNNNDSASAVFMGVSGLRDRVIDPKAYRARAGNNNRANSGHAFVLVRRRHA